MCSTNCAFPRTQGGTDCVSLPTGYHDEAPFLSHIGDILELCGQSLRVKRQNRLALDVQVRVLQQVRYCLDGKDLPALCSEKFSEWFQHWQVGQEVQEQLKLGKIFIPNSLKVLRKVAGFAQGHHQTGSGWFPSAASVGPLR